MAEPETVDLSSARITLYIYIHVDKLRYLTLYATFPDVLSFILSDNLELLQPAWVIELHVLGSRVRIIKYHIVRAVQDVYSQRAYTDHEELKMVLMI